ncbi:DUF4129 domain-containing protein [Edaphocola flava]|uniref:DUF4129 domain-containing protein n=1 Tax=Edaphocola flava TaxID=2499629 RepID=UPI00100AB61B|nr:DUF4129 domain-containing protein [Edaphocola flava]
MKHLFIYFTALLLSLSLSPGKASAQSVVDDEDPDAAYVSGDTVYVSDTAEDGYTTYPTEEYEEETFTFSYIDSIAPVTPEPRKISDAAWAKLTSDPDFRYTQPKEEPVQEYKESLWSKIITAIFEFFAGPFGTFLLWAVVGLVVIAIIWQIVRHNGLPIFGRKDKKVNNLQQDELADDFIPESWEDIIRKAEQIPDYRLAVRHSYRHVLLLLHERGLIAYSPSGSNYQYVSVLRQSGHTELHVLLTQLLRHYEYAWYGGFTVDAAHYQSIQSIYQQLKQKIA